LSNQNFRKRSGISSIKTLSKDPIEKTAPAMTPGSTITLHKLCERCTGFLERWEPLRLVQEPVNSRYQDLAYSSLLCTVAQLADTQRHCHFCALLLASLDRWPFVDRKDVLDMNIWLHRRNKVEDGMFLHALFAEEQPKSAEEGRNFAIFGLETYHGKQLSDFIKVSGLHC
jgi:hypothetical protein